MDSLASADRAALRSSARLQTAALAVLLACACDGRPAPAEDTRCLGPPHPEQPLYCFQGCTRDDECVPVYPVLPCACVPWLVNRAFQQVAAEKARREARGVQARDAGREPGCGCWGCYVGPECRSGLCWPRYQCMRPEPDGAP